MPTPRQYGTNADRQKAYRERQREARATELQQKGLPPTPAIPTMPGTARWNALLEQSRRAMETCREEMEAYFQERSEEWQESERGEQMQEKIEEIGEILERMESIS